MLFLIRFLAWYNKSGLRGSYRLTTKLAKTFASLQDMPVKVKGGTVFLDLRIASARAILANPKCQTGEDLVISSFVKSGDVVFDIGAHLGFYMVQFSDLVGTEGRVCAFEPNPELLPSLRKSVALTDNVTLFELALSDKDGTIELFVPEDASMASLRNWTDGIGGKVHEVQCEMQRLDDLIEAEDLPPPDFIKCDVEGAEISVFHGAKKTLNSPDAPIVMFEVIGRAASAFGKRASDYLDVFRSLDTPRYRLFVIEREGISELVSDDIDYANVVAIPESSLHLCEAIRIDTVKV